MKKIFTLSFILITSGVAFAQQTDSKSTPAPDLKVVPIGQSQDGDKKAEEALALKEESFDFGKIPQGKPVTHVFEVSNISKAPVTITNVQASCGCTTPEWEHDKPIAAGGKTNITVGYNAAAEGVFTKLVTVTYGENQTKQITIKGEVWKTPASSAPTNASLNDLKN